ncbi:MAG: FAD:protein FMN transferase, partial [Micrococcales bacterium]
LARGETSVAKCPPVVNDIWDACEEWEKITDGWFSAFTPQHTFDPSGIVKTWAAKAAAQQLVDAGITDLTMNAGGDVWISDGATPRSDWRIAIHKPVSVASAEAGLLTVIDLKDTPYRAMATSGSAERGQHIWNPKAPEKAAATELVQVSVVARDLVEADIWATAAFAAGSRGIALLNNFNAAHPDRDIQALFIWPDGELGATENFVRLFAKGDNG